LIPSKLAKNLEVYLIGFYSHKRSTNKTKIFEIRRRKRKGKVKEDIWKKKI